MLTLNFLYVIILFLMTIFTLMIGVFNDVSERRVNSFLFVPVFMVALIIYSASDASPWLIGISSGFFVLTFLRLKPILYSTGGIILLALALVSGQAEYTLYFLVLFFMYIIGTNERFYGIGDVKAFISISFAFVAPVPNAFTLNQIPLLSYVPFNFIFLMNTAIFSVMFIPYLLILNHRISGTFRSYHSYALDYDEKIYSEHPERYRIVEKSGEKIMIYGSPSLLPIYLGFLVTFIFGLWFVNL